MASCERFEIAIEQRLAGALSDDESKELDQHLAQCERCASYERGARSMHQGLRSLASGAVASVDWDRLERRMRERRQSRLVRLGVGMGLGVLAVVLSSWGFAPPGGEVPFALIVSATVATIVIVRAVVVLRELRRLAGIGRGEELLVAHRQYLEKQLRTIRQFRWIALVVVGWCIFNAVVSHEHRHVLVHLGLAAIVAGSWLHTLLWTYPRSRRELHELDPRVPER